jgi:hypothetical protein
MSLKKRFIHAVFISSLLVASTGIHGADLGFATDKIEAITGLKGTVNATEAVFKITSPRKDVPIQVDGWTMPPFMGLTSWAAFKAGGRSPVMVMGDIVLFEDEVNPVMSAALNNGLQVTALHNHFFYDEPRVYFMHINGEGTAEDLAGGVKSIFAAIAEVRSERKEPAKRFASGPIPEKSAITAEALQSIFGAKAQKNSGMAKFVFGRDVTMSCGCPAGAEMGVNTWAAFAGTDDNAVVDGDFAVHEDELQAVLKSLRGDGISIVAIHSHMTGESPRTLFLHYWGRGKAAELAASLKKAMATQNK